jgi:hypothetical protein
VNWTAEVFDTAPRVQYIQYSTETMIGWWTKRGELSRRFSTDDHQLDCRQSEFSSVEQTDRLGVGT